MESATSALKCSDILGEDTLVNILGLLPAKSLASAACVCRSWNSAARVLNATPRMMSALSLLPDLQVLTFEFLFFFLNPPSPTLYSGQQFQFPLLQDSEHLHWLSVCGPALEILDEVQQSNPVDPLEDWCDPGKMHIFQSHGVALEQSGKYSQIIFIDCSLFLSG